MPVVSDPACLEALEKMGINTQFAAKLSALRIEAQQAGLPAVHLALHMLHACYLEGMQRDFAKHCTEFSIHKIAPQSTVSTTGSIHTPPLYGSLVRPNQSG